MIKLLLQRFVLLIPTLFVVLWFSFYLSVSAPGDEVISMLSLEGKNTNVKREDFNNLYRSTQRLLAKDRPHFYFSLLPHYQPNNIYDFVPKTYRDNLLKINREVRNWDYVSSYHNQLEKLNESLAGNLSDHRKILILINELQKEDKVERIKSKEIEIDQLIADWDTTLSYQPLVVLKDLKMAISNLSKGPSWTYPVVHWNGVNNQFHYWAGTLFQPEKRISLRDGAPVFSKIWKALGWTLTLSMISLMLSCTLSLFIAVAQVRYHESLLDRIISNVLYILYAIPLFWFATLMVVFFTSDDYGKWTHIFPSIGMKYWMSDESSATQFWLKAKLLVLPILCITLNSLTYLTRQLKTDLLRQEKKPYVIPVRAKGVTRKRLIWSHLLPNALMPYITIITGAIPRTIVGSVVIEFIFNIPGVGKLLMDSIQNGDWPVSFSIILLVGILTIFSFLLADILYIIFYPQMAKSLLSRS